VDQLRNRGDAGGVPAQFVRVGDRDGPAVTRRFYASAVVVCGGQVFCRDRLHMFYGFESGLITR